MLFHWVTAAAFLAAYVVVYDVIWIVDPETSVKPALLGWAPDAHRVVPLLNIHWVLGLTIGFLTLPRLLWRLFGTRPAPLTPSRAEVVSAELAHWALYALLLVMPLSGYMNTYDPTNFGLFVVPAFKQTGLHAWLVSAFGWSPKQIEDSMEALHRFAGTWVALPLIGLHVVAALTHHFVRRDAVLRRMLPSH
jgi:cytochrome b561